MQDLEAIKKRNNPEYLVDFPTLHEFPITNLTLEEAAQTVKFYNNINVPTVVYKRVS